MHVAKKGIMLKVASISYASILYKLVAFIFLIRSPIILLAKLTSLYLRSFLALVSLS